LLLLLFVDDDDDMMTRQTIRQTDTHLTACFSRTTWVIGQQKGKTILDFNDTRDDGVAVASAGLCANHLHLAADK